MSETMPKTAREFDAKVDALKRGEVVVYHQGLLMRDRQFDTAEAHTVHALGLRAWRAAEAGVVALVQRRLEPGVCAYLAVKL
jgi:hypothetical protein